MADALATPLPPATRPLKEQPGTDWILLPLYLGFLATGTAVALPGAILPVLLQRWHLHDQGGGTIFLLAFVGSSLGALLVTGSLLRAVAFGGLTIALAVVGISLLPVTIAFLCIFVFGLGLGATMTAVSLVVQARSEHAGRAQVRLNLMWSLGACACPAFALKSLKTGDLRFILYPLATGFFLLGIWAIIKAKNDKQSRQAPVMKPRASTQKFGDASRFFAAVPLPLIVLIMLSTGIEASAGGWLATYAHRGGDSFAGIIAAPTCLWTGLFLSRLLWSALPPMQAERVVIRSSLILVVCAAFTLLANRHGWPFFTAALCFGFGAGPLYPLLLARALKVYASSVIFFMAGVSSAVLPWMMGLVAISSHSLQTAFYVPAFASIVMLILSYRIAPLSVVP